jgi:FtsZ-binding cell division protein ZapB
MNLPLVLDIALGLIFIFLILSLLASEIQELITTLLQWRAEHLKKSIENLLTGNPGNSSERTSNLRNSSEQEQFANELYRSPLIKALNQEAKGRISRFFRQISHSIGAAYRAITRTRNVFGDDQHSGPSYMPAETFAVALLQKLDIELLGQALSKQTITEFIEEKLNLIEDVLMSLRNSVGDDSLLANEFEGLKQNLRQISADFIQRRTGLSVSLDQAIEQLSRFIDNTEMLLVEDNHCKEIIRSRLPYLRQAILLRKLEPTIAETLNYIFDPAHQDQLPPLVREVLTQIQRKNPELPEELKRSLMSLAKQAQVKADNLDQGVLQLQREVEAWFNRSMERASGVYRRNAKGVAILIGFLLATAANADTFHIINRLAKDSFLRSAVTQAASQVISETQTAATLGTLNPAAPAGETAANAPPLAPAVELDRSAAGASAESAEALQTDLQAVRIAVDRALEGLLLPIGWSETNLQEQRLAETAWGIPFLQRFLGWFISGIALSMGANFWYDLLGRVIRVRSTGRPRNASTEDID